MPLRKPHSSDQAVTNAIPPPRNVILLLQLISNVTAFDKGLPLNELFFPWELYTIPKSLIVRNCVDPTTGQRRIAGQYAKRGVSSYMHVTKHIPAIKSSARLVYRSALNERADRCSSL